MRAEIPYGAYWSTPFARWQGSLAHLHSIEFAAHVVRNELARRGIVAERIDHGVLGLSVPQPHAFLRLAVAHGARGRGRRRRADGHAGLRDRRARVLLATAQEIEAGMAEVALGVTCDRTSNGPHLYYPNPRAPGGTGAHEDWVLQNFNCDPLGPHSMLDTAENAARRHGFTTAEQHDIVLRREEQYRTALADDSAFLKRFMTLPFDVPAANLRKTQTTLGGDEGINHSTAEGLARLAPVQPGGTVTFGAQTHPADGNAAILVASPGRAAELSSQPKIAVRLLGFGQAREKLAQMPEATSRARGARSRGRVSRRARSTRSDAHPFALDDLCSRGRWALMPRR